MKPNSISGVTCYVADLDGSAAFYEALGFRLGKRDADHVTCYVNWFWIDLIAQRAEDHGDRRTQARAGRRGVGVFVHIKVDDLDEVAEVARSLGLSPGDAHARAGNREILLRDPDGHNLVFFTRK